MGTNVLKGVLATIAASILVAAFAGCAVADQVKLNVGLGQPVLTAGKKQITYLKVGLTGFSLKSDRDRTPVNVAIVIDRSGSMTGPKLQKAKEAALMAIDRLSNRDIVSVVAYDHEIMVLVPATRLADKEPIREAISALEARGSTALFAGVSKAAAELRKFLDGNRVNRIILLSDGLANVGPSSPEELADLGASLRKDGISVTTVGLGTGYNEDLMSKLAAKSDGNHYFAEEAADLARIYKGELGDVLSVVAQEVVVEIRCAGGIRPIRVLGREADITGQRVIVMLNQIYSEQEKYVLMEVEVPETGAGKSRPVATVTVSYANMQTRTTDKLTSTVAARFSDSEDLVEKETNKAVMVSAVEQVATAVQREAMRLRDEGKRAEASKMLHDNAKFLYSNAAKYKGTAGADRLDDYGRNNTVGIDNVLREDGDATVEKYKKEARAYQRYNEEQQFTK